MSDWTEAGVPLTNQDSVYDDFLKRTGTTAIDHWGIFLYGDPMQESFLSEISISEHNFALGDSLSKIAFKEYGDPRLWWVLAWFNTKPTDLHCAIGDKIIIPFPLNEVLNQVFKRIEL